MITVTQYFISSHCALKSHVPGKQKQCESDARSALRPNLLFSIYGINKYQYVGTQSSSTPWPNKTCRQNQSVWPRLYFYAVIFSMNTSHYSVLPVCEKCDFIQLIEHNVKCKSVFLLSAYLNLKEYCLCTVYLASSKPYQIMYVYNLLKQKFPLAACHVSRKYLFQMPSELVPCLHHIGGVTRITWRMRLVIVLVITVSPRDCSE